LLKPARRSASPPKPIRTTRRYIGERLHGLSPTELFDLGKRIAEYYGDEHLTEVLGGLGPRGVDGELKQLIFAADGPKPRSSCATPSTT
jgi:hypothetical protein